MTSFPFRDPFSLRKKFQLLKRVCVYNIHSVAIWIRRPRVHDDLILSRKQTITTVCLLVYILTGMPNPKISKYSFENTGNATNNIENECNISNVNQENFKFTLPRWCYYRELNLCGISRFHLRYHQKRLTRLSREFRINWRTPYGHRKFTRIPIWKHAT